jgi:hypothetical protein
MWNCPLCNQQFVKINHPHSCNERTVEDFLAGKSPAVVELFQYFVGEYLAIGPFKLHPAKSRIAFAADIRFGYIHRLGKDFLDVVLTFHEPYHDNLCFYRIGEVPGGKYFQHYLRLYKKEDLNKEVRTFMKMALESGKRN